jgi:cholesterol oxidase
MAQSAPVQTLDSDVLSLPLTHLRAHYDVVVIGTGYGGAIAACRLAQARAGDRQLSVCVLERGREIHAGSYPTSTAGFLKEAQFTTDSEILGREDGLFDFRISGDVAVILGCGLGGTSLINAGVAIEPEDWVLHDPAWPLAVRKDLDRFRAGVGKAKHMLGSSVYPATAKVPGKLQAMRKSALAMGAECITAAVNVSFDAHVNPAGVAMSACTLCGDCVTGCNHGAKNTTLRNYLPLARNHGAEMFTQVSVRHLERRDDKWVVHFEPVGTGRDLFTGDLGFVTADLVVLGAGTMGSTEILLRTKEAGLPLSDRVGEGFSGNGDVLAFGYNTEEAIGAVGTGENPVDPEHPPGPCISGIIDLRKSEATPQLGMVLQDGVLPAAFAPAMPALLEFAATTGGKDLDHGFFDKLRELGREAQSLVEGPRHGAIAQTQTYLVMTHDDASGRLAISGPRAHVTWPGAGDAEYLQRVDERLQEATRALGGTHIPDPVWVPWLNNKLISCHPLGGCAMAEDATRGVVDERGRVFAGQTGTAVHPGLYVCDGSVVPRALGVNPLLTISGLAERAMELLLQDHGWTLATDVPAPPPVVAPKLGMRFTERMAGTIGLGETETFDPERFGADVRPTEVALVLLVQSDDLDEVLDTPGHTARLTGTVTAPGLHPLPLEIEAGEFALFPEDPTQADTRLMRYRFRAVSEDGGTWWFDGVKIIRDDPGMDVWEDTTTLFTTVYAGPDSHSPVLGKGILKVHLWDLTKSMATLEVLNAPSLAVKLSAAARCARYFFGTLAHVYGGLST